MFGEEPLIGLTKTNISKSLLSLPDFTCALDYETLILSTSNNNLAIYSPQVIFKKLDMFFANQKNILTYKELQALKRIIYGKLLSEAQVTAKKIALPPKARNYFKKSVYIKGYNDHIRVFNNLEDIKKYELTLK